MANKFKKISKELDELERGAKKRRIQIQCNCPHRDRDGQLQLVTVKNGQNDTITAYKCEQCGAVIDKKAPKGDEVDDAIKTVLTALEYMKISINPHTDKDEADIETLGGIMQNLIALKGGYKKTLERNGKRNKERNGRARRSTITVDD